MVAIGIGWSVARVGVVDDDPLLATRDALDHAEGYRAEGADEGFEFFGKVSA